MELSSQASHLCQTILQAGMALPVTPTIDRVGYRVVDCTGRSMFEVLIKYCREDPWAGLDLITASPLRSVIP